MEEGWFEIWKSVKLFMTLVLGNPADCNAGAFRKAYQVSTQKSAQRRDFDDWNQVSRCEE